MPCQSLLHHCAHSVIGICRVLTHLDTQGLGEEDATTLRFLVQAQALLQASASDASALKRWTALSQLSRGPLRDRGDMHSRLSRATAAADASGSAGAPPLLLQCSCNAASLTINHAVTDTEAVPVCRLSASPAQASVDPVLCTGVRPLALHEVADIVAGEELNAYGIMAPSGPQVMGVSPHARPCVAVRHHHASAEHLGHNRACTRKDTQAVQSCMHARPCVDLHVGFVP